MRLLHKVIALSTIPMAALVSATGWVLTNAIESQLEVELASETAAQLALRRLTLEQYLQFRFDELAHVAAEEAFRIGDEAERLEILRARLEPLKTHFEGLYLDDLDGDVVGVDGSRFNVKDRPYFERIRAGERVVSNVIFSRATQARIIVLTVPLHAMDETLEGALAGTVLVDDLVESAPLSAPRFGGFAALLEEDGTLLSEERLPPGARAGVFGSEIADGVIEIDGDRYLAFATEGPVRHWRIVIGYPEETTFAFLRALRRATLIAIIAAVLLTGLVAAFVARRITRPVADLLEAHARVAAGDLEAHVEVEAKDEIGDIAESFNRMVERIRAEARSRADAEGRLERAQRLETVGLLAGGIAHDFNNLLMAILANAQFVGEDSDDPEVHASVIEIVGAAKRGADLTRQLLGFARKQPHRPTDVDLAELVRSMEPFLSRLLPETIRLSTDVEDGCGARIDAGQIQQVLLNLVINARDAIEGQGEVAVAVFADGDWATLVVHDDGSGIPPEVLPQIFDPFFSTKDATRGTGLGLAMVHGIVEQHGGQVEVTSEPGATTFTLRFARVASDRVEPTALPTPDVSSLVGRLPRGRVLVVEDDPSVQRATVEGLRRAGVDVDVAADGQDALERFERAPQRFIALVTDVVMPRMSGPSLAAKVRETRPDIPVVFVTGYHDRSVDGEVDLPVSAVIMKPATTEQILAAVEALIHGSTRTPPPPSIVEA